MSKLKELNRRELLQFLGAACSSAALSPVQLLTQSLISGLATNAYAAELKLNPRRLLYIQLAGGPPRWVFDQFLNPYNSPGFVQNLQTSTKYKATNGRYTTAEHSTVPLKGIHAPWMWQFDLPTVNGGQRPMADLLDNLLALQGLDSGNDSHDISRVNVFTPLGAMQSFTAMPGDSGSSPIKSVSCGVSLMTHKSAKNYSNINLREDGRSNLVQDLMDPFTSTTSAAYNSKKEQLQSYINASMTSLQNTSQSEHFGANSITSDQKTVAELLAYSLNGLSTYWTATVAKYDSLIRRSLDMTNPLPGISDLPIGSTARDNTYRINPENTLSPAEDLRTLIPLDGRMGLLARHMALAEYLFVNKLTHSLTINPGTFAPVDEHTTGVMVSLVQQTYSWRAYAACLLELISQFKNAQIFNDTVIAVVGDFNRSPHMAGTGSDHRPTASSGVFYSGAIQGPMILGEMKANSGPKLGTIGDGDRTRDYGNLLSSSAQLLRVPSPVTAKQTLITEVNGVITAAIEKSTLK